MKAFKKVSLAVCTSALLLPALSHAQTANQTFGPQAGDREFTISGAGTSDKEFDNGAMGLSGEMGWYLTDQVIAGVRQGVAWGSVDNGSDDWAGTTKGYIDYQFGQNQFRPFVGANLGVKYYNHAKNTGTAGLELGAKYYVLPSTFVQARAEYSFLFDSGSSAKDNSSNGSWDYTVGMGYNF
ncbi:outer membrane beta-barrel protein [Oceanisphaera pacifica]|uniref:Outer membrane beta-barrel protein n=1 Tax=Oceanisphaera pacifica TaxID=2818389 RepID=A0ABS3NGQ4_9GAMM|nr:outer membrane beta-barrel protein [Oceanisphaera pacifica]MBO1519512.1 outer membrane beta-barrel protein [Oceanisphaera pacifica]